MIQTVNGKIKKVPCGKMLIHEHISCASNDFIKSFDKRWLDRDYLEDYASDVLCTAKGKYDIGLLVDGTPIDLGRDANLMKNTSRKSGVHIVASTGFYWHHTLGIDGNADKEIAEWLITECEEGMEDTDVKPGILKCAAGNSVITDETVKKHSAIGIVQSETGLPVYVHCMHTNNMAFEQIDILKKHGANTEKIIIGHGAQRPSSDYFENVLKSGCFVSIDQCHCYPDRLTDIANCIVNLCKKGYSKKILLSNDYCIHSDFVPRKYNGLHLDKMQQVTNLGYVYDHVFKEFCKCGGKPEDWVRITEQNPFYALDVY
jgi:phosphotriesterase-related protein